MNNYWKIVFYIIIVFSILHTIRDTLQIFKIHTLLSDFYVTHDNWCSTFCDYVAFPFELFTGIGAYIVLRRNKVSVLGLIVLLSLLFWPLTFFLK